MIPGLLCRNLAKRFHPAKNVLILLAVLLIFVAFASPALAEAEKEWQFFTQFNLWVPDIKIETTGDKDIKIGIDEIVDNLDFTYMGTIGASKDRWTFLTDVIYLNLEHDVDYTLIDNPLLGLDLTNLEMTAWIASPMVVYDVLVSDQMTLGVLAGARYLYLKLETETTARRLLTTAESSDSNSGDAWNGIVGVRGFVYLPGQWYVPYFFDIGTGDTDLTWQAFAAVAYRFENVGVSLGYRHLEWDLDESDAGGELFDKLYVSGPMIGIKYWF